MEKSPKCDFFENDFLRLSNAKHLRKKQHLENEKQNELILKEWLLPK